MLFERGEWSSGSTPQNAKIPLGPEANVNNMPSISQHNNNKIGLLEEINIRYH